MNRFNTVVLLMFVGSLFLGCGTSKPAESAPETTVPSETSIVESQTETPAVEETAKAPEMTQQETAETTAPAAEIAENEAPAETTHTPALNDAENDEIPPDFFRCEVKLIIEDVAYTAQAIGPTLEEGLDNAAEEACAIPCAEKIASKQLSDDEAENEINNCAEGCVEIANVVGSACWQNSKQVFEGGDWSNSAEDSDAKQVQE